MKTFYLSCISLAALATATPAFADEAVDARDNDIVVTATGTAQSIDEVGQAITIIDEATILRRQNVSIADLLGTTAGVRFNRTGNEGAVTGVSLRGAETTQTLVLIDGVRVNDPAGIGNQFDFGSLLVGNLNRVEVLRGSNSVVYGSQAIGGVVNVSTAAPGDAEGFGVKASGEYGARDTVNAKGNVTANTGILAASAGVAYFNTDGISTKTGTERDPYENISANARVKLSFTDAINLDLRGYYIHADLDFDSDFGAGDSPDVAITDQYIGYAGLNVALFDGKFTNRIAASYYRQNRDYYFIRSNTPDYGYVGNNWRFEYQGVVQPIEPVRLIFGYEHEKPEYRGFGFGSTSRYEVNIDSAYALAVFKPLKGLAVTAGVRHDDHSQFGGATTFGANANYSPNDGATNIRVAYGEGFKAPSLYQLYDFYSGNAALKPERSKSYDIGIDQSALDGRLKASVTLFRRTVRDQISYSFGAGYGNLDLTRAKGVEFNLELKPIDALTVTADYSYIRAFDRSPTSPNFNRRLARRAPHQVSVSADYDWAFGLSLGGTVTVVDDSFNNAANTVRVNGYVVAGVRASYDIDERFQLFGRIDNIFDEQYQIVSGYNTYGRSAYAGLRVKL